MPRCAKDYFKLEIGLIGAPFYYSSIHVTYDRDFRKSVISGKPKTLNESEAFVLNFFSVNTNKCAYFLRKNLTRSYRNDFYHAISGDTLCGFLHDFPIALNCTGVIQRDGKYAEKDLAGIQLPFFRQLCNQVVEEESTVDHSRELPYREYLQRRYAGKNVLQVFWSDAFTSALYEIEMVKKDFLVSNDMAFVYVYIGSNATAANKWLSGFASGEILTGNNYVVRDMVKNGELYKLPTIYFKDRLGNYFQYYKTKKSDLMADLSSFILRRK